MTGVSMPRWRMARRTSKPSVPGISRSRMTQSTGSRISVSSPSAPPIAVRVSYPPTRWRSYAYCSAMAGRSSTISTTVIGLPPGNGSGSSSRARRSRLGRRRDGEGDRDARTPAGLGVHAQRAAEIGDEPTYDREAESGSVRLRGVEVVEGPGQLALAHPAPGVRDDNAHHGGAARITRWLRAHRNLTSLALEAIDRVPDEIL